MSYYSYLRLKKDIMLMLQVVGFSCDWVLMGERSEGKPLKGVLTMYIVLALVVLMVFTPPLY